MITVRQIDRLWSAKAYDRLLEQLVSPRPEASDRLLAQLGGALPAAAMAVIRLDELSQSFVPLYSQLVRTILAAHRPDGGWGDVQITALCLRALLCGKGNGSAIDRGIAHLAALQNVEGVWPDLPNRRMPIDAFASAYVLFCLGGHEVFQQAVNLHAAVDWFNANQPALNPQTSSLWKHTLRRLPVPRPTHGLRSSVMNPVKKRWAAVTPHVMAESLFKVPG
jgi:hypothetical protein